MRTLIKILLTLSLASFLFAQVDTTQTDTPVAEEPVAEQAVETVADDTTAVETEVAEVAEPDTSMIDSAEIDAQVAELEEAAPAEEVPSTVRVIGLVNDGQVYYWSNDGIPSLGLEAYVSLSYGNPALVAAKANDCLDIVCNLLATDLTDADFVIVTPTDTTDVKVYEISTRTTVIEAGAEEIATAFAVYLGERPVETPMEAMTADTTAEEVSAPLVMGPDRSRSFKIRNRQFRSMEALFSNPANLARDFETKTSWNFIPDFNINIHNSLLTPGWYKEWFTTGEVWDAATKNEYLSTIMDQDLAINVRPQLPTVLGFRVGRFGVNVGTDTHVKVVLPGNLLGLPMQDIYLNEPIDNGGVDIEAIPFVAKTSISYAHPLTTAFGDLKVGANINLFEAGGYARIVSDDFSITMTEDSVEVSATGEAWVTGGSNESVFDEFDGEAVEPSDALSNLGFGVDVGAVLDLYDRLDQEVEVHVALKNLGAKYTWSNVTQELWTYDLKMPVVMEEGDSIENYETEETTLVASGEEFSVSVPMVFSVGAIYQPFPQLLVGAGIEKAFTDEAVLGYSPDLEFSLQLNYYPASWFDISYYLQPRFGDPAHILGSGFHFGFLDMGMNVTFINGFNSDAKGIGFGFHSSLHF